MARVLLFLLFSWNLAFAQNPELIWHNYTSDDGLASNEVHYCLQTPDGYMWFATDSGLSRYDGYEFKNYGTREGLTNPVVFNLQLDPDGRLWMATLSGELYYLENDRIHPFAGNDTIRSLLEQSSAYYNGRQFKIDSTGQLFLPIVALGILEFSPDGQMQLHEIPEDSNPFKFFAMRIQGEWLMTFNHFTRDDRPTVENYPTLPITLRTDSTFLLRGVPYSENSFPLGFIKEFTNGRNWFVGWSHISEFAGARILSQNEISYDLNPKTIFEMADGSILCGTFYQEGLYHFTGQEDWGAEAGDPNRYLAGTRVSHVFRDQQENIWVSTIENGVYMCSQTERRLYDRSVALPNDHVTSIAIKDEHDLFIGLRSGTVYQLNRQGTVDLLPFSDDPNPRVIYDLLYLPSLEELWTGTNLIMYWENGDWHHTKNLIGTATYPRTSGKKLFLNRDTTTIWTSTPTGFCAIDINQKITSFCSIDRKVQLRTQAIWESADQTIWVGTINGLFVFDGDTLQRPSSWPVELNSRVEDLAELSDGTLVIASKGEGLLLLKDSLFHQFTIEDGLSSNMAENVYVDVRDNIWFGTLNGLNKVRGFNWGDRSAATIQQIWTEHGLPSNEITDVEVWEDEVWVATTKGLVQFPDRLVVDSLSRAPLIAGFEVHGRTIDSGAEMNLFHTDNSVVLQFMTLNFRQHGNIMYRYRLPPAATSWEETTQREVNYSALAPGRYTFEVQSRNEDGFWSATTTYSFRIHPPWWERWWARLLATLLIAGAIFASYLYRTRQLKKEIQMQKQLAQVERQALRSQMNPHFIFNALNAIQGHIALGDKASANRYLSRFAKLIRAALQHSRMTKVPLEDDIRQLTDYLELEQSRFRGSFVYDLQLAEAIDAARVEIPPMLIQPFVENAVVHGLSAQEENGRIDIRYELQEGYLRVTVRDNGVGIETSRRLKSGRNSAHKSIGLSVTQRRLEMLNEDNQFGKVELAEIKGPDGKVQGTQAEIWIPLE